MHLPDEGICEVGDILKGQSFGKGQPGGRARSLDLVAKKSKARGFKGKPEGARSRSTRVLDLEAHTGED